MALTNMDRIMLNDQQEQRIIDATNLWQQAKDKGDTKGMAAAHAIAEAVRAEAGYSGGDWGNQFINIGGLIGTSTTYNGSPAATPTQPTPTTSYVGNSGIGSGLNINTDNMATLGAGAILLFIVLALFKG